MLRAGLSSLARHTAYRRWGHDSHMRDEVGEPLPDSHPCRATDTGARDVAGGSRTHPRESETEYLQSNIPNFIFSCQDRMATLIRQSRQAAQAGLHCNVRSRRF